MLGATEQQVPGDRQRGDAGMGVFVQSGARSAYDGMLPWAREALLRINFCHAFRLDWSLVSISRSGQRGLCWSLATRSLILWGE